MSEYERFTQRVDSGFVSELDCKIAYNKLSSIEDKIENGTLIGLPCVAYNVKECKYQIISTKNGRVYASKFWRDRKEAEAKLKELEEKQQ